MVVFKVTLILLKKKTYFYLIKSNSEESAITVSEKGLIEVVNNVPEDRL